jgi:hypothetical protein
LDVVLNRVDELPNRISGIDLGGAAALGSNVGETFDSSWVGDQAPSTAEDLGEYEDKDDDEHDRPDPDATLLAAGDRQTAASGGEAR